MNNFIPKGNIYIPRKSTDYVRGVSSPIAYVVRNDTGNWQDYFPLYESQKYIWDSNCCWAFSGAHAIETQLNFLLKTGRLPQATIDWFTTNGYIVNGSFEISWRFIVAISGVDGDGNSQYEWWRLTADYGILPRSLFDYSLEQSQQFSSEEAQNDDIGSTIGITQRMYQLAKQALSYVQIDYEWVGNEGTMPPLTDIRAMLLQSPLQIGIAVNGATWNQTNVPAYSGVVQHAVMLGNLNTDNSFIVFDDYMPNPKTLANGYDVPLITNGVISPILEQAQIPTVTPFPQNVWQKVWVAVAQWFQSLFTNPI